MTEDPRGTAPEAQPGPQALAADLRRYRTMVEHAVEGIAVGQGGIIRFANQQCLALLGTTAAQAPGRPMIEYVHPDDRAMVTAHRDRRSLGEAVPAYEARFLRPDGAIRWVEINGVVVEWEGAPANLFFLKDTTERHAMDEALKTALVRERELGELKTRLLSMASHEFRTPLAAILSSAELIAHYGEKIPADEQQAIMADLVAAARRMQLMLEDMLTLGQAEAGRLVFQPRPADLEALCRQAVAEVRSAHPRHVLVLHAGPAGVRAVDIRLVQYILANLLANGCKYSPEGTEVSLRMECEGATLRLQVSDSGIGIADADLPHLFESFRRGANVGHRPGSGLGLAIVKRCVSLHGGDIQVVSKLGAGSTFSVTLPVPPP